MVYIDRTGTYQPAPATALNSGCFCVEFFFKSVHGTKVTVNSGFEGTVCEFASALVRGSKICPEKRMIDMTWTLVEEE